MADRYVIIAPHVDDEVIGCFSLLAQHLVTTVYYKNSPDLTAERWAEALAAHARFGFSCRVLSDKSWVPSDVIIALPNCKDSHADHKQINAQFRRVPNRKVFYSVDMNVKKEVLSPELQEQKRLALHELFPSQASLLEHNDKYWLFESILPTDLTYSITVSTQFEGIHSYPNAPAGVEFLKHPHRHMFVVTVELEVMHNDREVEFILFKRELDTFIRNNGPDLQNKSCEMVAEQLLEETIQMHPNRNCKVTVSEDGENGSTVRYEL